MKEALTFLVFQVSLVLHSVVQTMSKAQRNGRRTWKEQAGRPLVSLVTSIIAIVGNYKLGLPYWRNGQLCSHERSHLKKN